MQTRVPRLGGRGDRLGDRAVADDAGLDIAREPAPPRDGGEPARQLVLVAGRRHAEQAQRDTRTRRELERYHHGPLGDRPGA
jgi:hypothetical protein